MALPLILIISMFISCIYKHRKMIYEKHTWHKACVYVHLYISQYIKMYISEILDIYIRYKTKRFICQWWNKFCNFFSN